VEGEQPNGRRRRAIAACAGLAIFAGIAAGPAAAKPGPVLDRYAAANRCLAIAAPGGWLTANGDGYDATGSRPSAGEGFYFEPTALGRYLLFDTGERLLARGEGSSVVAANRPNRSGEWALHRAGDGFRISATHGDGALDVRRDGSVVTASGPGARFELTRRGPRHCAHFPDATPGARGAPPPPVNADGTVFGFADTHLHITADMRAGGRVIDGRAFDRYGIAKALGGDARNHGPDGSLDVTGNLLRTGLPFGTHDVHGWPSFEGWPVNDTNTHQQVYYRWLERMWMAGERIVVAQTIEDEPLCRIEPVRSHSCDETKVIAKEIGRLRALESYVDAQSGGPGEGWFRLVYGPGQARRVVEQGKLAVVIGVESSNPLGCSEDADCMRRDVDRGIAHLKRLGVRSLFIAHWVDNGFAGSALEGGTKGTFISVFNVVQNGHYFDSGPCPHPSQGEEVNTLGELEMSVLEQFFPATAGLPPMPEYPPGKQCNTKGLTPLGAYLVRRLIANHMLIEVDHLSEFARERVLRIAAGQDYPLISSHNGTGGSWTRGELHRLYRSGGLASATPAQTPELADRILGFRRFREPGFAFGVGLGTDTGGFSSLPGPPESAGSEIDYPFEGYRSGISFRRQRTGERTFDLNDDGVAHYGLFADLLAGMREQANGEAATRTLFRSAEAYLQMWERARRHR
jgi:microsomal dipeptidase-like Zn-dependent dipeptidase